MNTSPESGSWNKPFQCKHQCLFCNVFKNTDINKVNQSHIQIYDNKRFFCHDECPTFCDNLGTMRRGFFLEITANKIFFTKPIMQSLSFVFIVNKAQIDPKMSMLTCQTTDNHTVSESCVFTLHLGLNISTMLDEMLINTVVVFFCPCGLIEASFYEITPYCSP